MVKNAYSVIIMMFLGFGFVHGQQNIETGPMAKNKKVWEGEYETTPIVYRTRKKLTGPLAKNARPERGNYWEDDAQ
ncbi:hypothetical protein [Allomuricauda sp. F6463D]|uniref:hypothetical protein n=1 Tax=Allomuricauda sp. F6463D TaxID=2926409 RepID=UPI001FF6737A|nr:hypothetical protein [Muricauda sp. F6463D]MCK0160882.1 hypothetical protein [Muricauda sp. F6463D]